MCWTNSAIYPWRRVTGRPATKPFVMDALTRRIREQTEGWADTALVGWLSLFTRDDARDGQSCYNSYAGGFALIAKRSSHDPRIVVRA